MITIKQIKNNPKIRTYIAKADESLAALGYTEHSFPHVTKVANEAGRILAELGYSEREQELAKIAGYLHDIGNVVNRVDHAQSGAVMAFRILEQMHMDTEETADIITAIGNHDEATAFPVNAIAAALILADKTDVRYTRVRKNQFNKDDIHDRVNYSVKESELTITQHEGIVLKLTIETQGCQVMEYFEIFLQRMNLCKKAAGKLGQEFHLIINKQKMM